MVEILGYALSPVTQAQKFFVFTSRGCSGKSTLGNILYRLAGGSKNVSSVPLNKLNDRFSKSVMVDKVLNLNTESDSHHRFDQKHLIVKRNHSGDEKSWRIRLSQKAFLGIPVNTRRRQR